MPSTPRGDAVEMVGGEPVPNPYSWLEDLESERVRTWAGAQDERTVVALEPALRSSRALAERLFAYAEAPIVNTPVRRGDAFFFMVDSSAHASPALYVHSAGRDEVLVDPADFAELGLEAAQIEDFRANADGSRVAVVGVEPSSGRRVLRIVDTRSGEYLADSVDDARLAEAPWTADDASIVYSTWDGSRGAAVWRHDLGSDAQVRILPADGGEDVRFSVDAVPGGLVILERRKPDVFRLSWVDGVGPQADEVVVWEQNGGSVVFLGASGGALYLHVLEVDGRESVIAARRSRLGFRAAPALDLSGLFASAVHLYGGRLVVNGGSSDGGPSLRIHDLRGAPLATLVPPHGLLWTNFPPNRAAVLGDWDARYAYTTSLSLDVPGVYEIDLQELTLAPWRLRDIDASADVVLRRVEYASADGVRVPMSLAYRADTSLDGSAPTLTWVYGAHGFTAVPFFSGFFRTFIEAGGVLAMPQVRGGGVFGKEWHEAGSGANKRNTVADTIAAFEWLIANGVTRGDRLAALGNSAGTVPVAVAAIERPDLVGALILEVPLGDLARHKRWRGGWTTEFGDPDVPEELEAILDFSPYQRLLEPAELPATLVFAGENDRIALPHHAFKLAASMQYAQSGGDPVYLRLVRGAGHQIGVNRTQRAESQALQLAFLTREIGLATSFRKRR